MSMVSHNGRPFAGPEGSRRRAVIRSTGLAENLAQARGYGQVFPGQLSPTRLFARAGRRFLNLRIRVAFTIELQDGGGVPRRLTAGQQHMYIRYHQLQRPRN